MTHTVKSGETLSKIAKANRVTLAQLLDANPKFKANPNRVRVGDVLNIPEGGTTPAPAPPAPPQPQPPTPQPQPQPAAVRVLGKLSEQFETSGRGPGTVGDPGGASYGSYQMTSKPNGGTVKRFVARPDFPFRDRFANLTPGSSQFTAVWKELATSRRDEFQNAQHDFIKQTHFDLLVQKIIDEDGLNVLTRSHTLQDVIWSTAVQHGAASNVPHRALGNVSLPPEAPDFDRSLIVAIYHERGRKRADGGLAHFPRAAQAVQKGVANRFKNELRDALKMLADELVG